MDMQNYTTPFANTGDREEFSIDTDPSGKVSLEKGWTELYQLRPEEGGLFILRKVFNQMMKLVSTDTVTWKTQSFPNWIDDKGDGLPFAYPKNAIVKATDGEIYVSLIDDNEDNPIGSINWSIIDLSDIVDKTTNQEIDSIKTFLKSPIVPTPTAGTQAVNKNYADLKVALTDFIGANQSLSGNGYQKLPGGMIVQWGYSSTGDVIFPISFNEECFVAIPLLQYNSTAEPGSSFFYIATKSNTGFKTGEFVHPVYYVAIGK